MFKNVGKSALRSSIRCVHSKNRFEGGPGLEDFIAEQNKKDNQGQLVLSKGVDRLRIPPWLKTTIPMGENYHRLKKDLSKLNLNTVCVEAKCPNIGKNECFIFNEILLRNVESTFPRSLI